MRYHVQIEKEQIPFTVAKLNTVRPGSFTYQPTEKHWITGPEKNSKSRCSEYQDYLIDHDNWSIIFEEISLDYDDEMNSIILEGHSIPCLHSDGCCQPALNHPYNIFWFLEECCWIFHICDFLDAWWKWRTVTDTILMTSLYVSGRRLRKILHALGQLFFDYLYHHWEQLLQPKYDCNFFHEKTFCKTTHIHATIYPDVFSLIVKVLIKTLETQTQLLLMGNHYSIKFFCLNFYSSTLWKKILSSIECFR